MLEAITAELDVFSGRPNPSWELSPQEAGELTTAVRSLAGEMPADAAKRASDGLGYRGVIVSNRSSLPGLPRELRAGGGFDGLRTDGEFRYFPDRAGIERLLLRQAERHGYRQLVESATRSN